MGEASPPAPPPIEWFRQAGPLWACGGAYIGPLSRISYKTPPARPAPPTASPNPLDPCFLSQASVWHHLQQVTTERGDALRHDGRWESEQDPGAERELELGSGCGWWGPSCSGRGPTGAFGVGVGRSLSDQGSKEQVLGTEDSGERERGAEGWWQREEERAADFWLPGVRRRSGRGKSRGANPAHGGCPRSAAQGEAHPQGTGLGEGRLQGVRESLADRMTAPTP